MRPLLIFVLLLMLSLLPQGCGVKEDFEPYDCKAEFEAFLKSFDAEYRGHYVCSRVRLKVLESAGSLENARREVKALLDALSPSANAEDPAWPAPLAGWLAAPDSGMDASLTNPRAIIRADLELFAALLAKDDVDWTQVLKDAQEKIIEHNKPGFFTFATAADIPADLAWETNLDAPEIGSPEARKGGTLHQWIPAFPPSLRVVGADSNNSFRSEHWDNIELSLVETHPDTGELIPAVADRWAVSADARTVFFHIDPEARYSDGVKVSTQDITMALYVQLNPYVNNPYGQNYYREQFTHLTLYTDQVFSVTLRRPKPLAPLMAGIQPAPRQYYKEIGPDFEKRYDWRSRPTTGAYEIRQDGIDKGKSLTLSRVENWWAKDRRYRRNRFNADRIEYRIIRDVPKAWEIFRKGDLDTFPLSMPDYWYERSEVPEVFNGYINRYTFYNIWPSQGTGLYLNTAKAPMDNRDVRLGLAFACDWQRVIEVILRGDAVRANAMQEGYVLITDAPVKARPYDPSAAREHFAKAGYVQADSDGILKNMSGERLSVAVTLTNVAARVTVVNLLAEQAKKAGLELRIDAIEGTSAYQKMSAKQHQIGYTGWGFTPPINDYHQFLHSSNAREKDGRLKTDTNNIFSYADPRMDSLCDQHRMATSLEEMSRLTAEIETIIYQEGLFIPGVRVPFTREASWRWVRWPENYATAACYIPYDSFVWWIDPALKKDTLEARVEGRTFPEIMAVKDTFRHGPPAAGSPEVAPPPPLPLPPS